MPQFIEPYIEKLVPYVPGKPIEEVERELGLQGVIKLASNENPLGTSPKAIEAMKNAIAQVHRYPDGGAFYLKKALADFLHVSPQALLLSNGSNEAIELIVRTLQFHGCNAITSKGAFIMYRLVATACGVEVKEAPMKSDMRFDLNAMLDLVDHQTRFVFLANPNNPTGTYIPQNDLLHFLDQLPKHVIVALDEAYFEYVDRPDYPDGIALLDRYENLMVMRTFSKGYGLAGLRIGYTVTHPKWIDYLNRVRAPFNLNHLAQVAARAALQDQDFVKKTADYNRKMMPLLIQGAQKLGLEVIDSVANFVLIRLPVPGKIAFKELQKHGVIVRPLDPYQMPCHIRVSVGLESEIRAFLNALETFLNHLDDIQPCPKSDF